MIPTIGRIVHYRLTAADAKQVNQRRVDAGLRFDKERALAKETGVRWSHGAQFHVGNPVAEGDVFPMLITRVWGQDVNAAVQGQVFLDGNDVLWATSVKVGLIPGTWMWPERKLFPASPAVTDPAFPISDDPPVMLGEGQTP